MSVGRPMWERAAENIRTRIVTGEFAPGEKLPPLAQLGVELRCSASALRQAFVALEAEGLIRRERGVGVLVAVPPPPTPTAHRHVFRWRPTRRPRRPST